MLVRHGDKFHAFGDDAAKLHEVSQVGDGQSAEFDADTLDHHVSSLVAAGHRVGVVDRTREGHPDWDSEADPEVSDTVAEERGEEPLAINPKSTLNHNEAVEKLKQLLPSSENEQGFSVLQDGRVVHAENTGRYFVETELGEERRGSHFYHTHPDTNNPLSPSDNRTEGI